MDYKIAIPSYQRAKTLKEKTLNTLIKNNISMDKVTVFVADEKEFEVYKKEIENTCNLQISAPTLRGSRNFIRKYFPEGTALVNFDDDLSDILYAKDEKTLIPVSNLEETIHKGFDLCKEHKAYIWGIYAASNPFFMKKEKSIGLYYIIGSMWGHFVRHDNDLILTLEDKEDYERSLQYYSKDGKVIRLDNITVKSNYYKEPGGMQVTRTSERILKSAEFLAEKYPHLCSMYIRETTGHAELRLKHKKTELVGSTLEGFL